VLGVEQVLGHAVEVPVVEVAKPRHC
jgi:hypothetical protein